MQAEDRKKSFLLHIQSFWYVVKFLLIFIYSFNNSQILPVDNPRNLAVVSVTDDAVIFSTDEYFNNHVSLQKISLQNAVADKNTSNGHSSISIRKSSKKRAGGDTLKEEILKTSARKKREIQKKLKRAEASAVSNLKSLSLTEIAGNIPEYSVFCAIKKLNCTSHENITYSFSDSSKNFYAQILIAISKKKTVIDFLHFFNDYLLTSVFSVRPPPAIIS